MNFHLVKLLQENCDKLNKKSCGFAEKSHSCFRYNQYVYQNKGVIVFTRKENRIMKRTKIAIIFGGNSTEYDVSLQSAASVCKHLNADRYEFALIGITWQGDWYHYVGEHENILDNTWYKEGEKLTPVVVSLNFNEKGFLQLSDCSYRLISVDLVFPYLSLIHI